MHSFFFFVDFMKVFQEPRSDNFTYRRICQDVNEPRHERRFFRQNHRPLHTARKRIDELRMINSFQLWVLIKF